MDDFDWLTGTYWCVRPDFLSALEASNTASPTIQPLVDQTVWRFGKCLDGYLTGISATNIGGVQSLTALFTPIAWADTSHSS